MSMAARRVRVLLVLGLLGSTVAAHAQVFPVLQGDPVDGFGRAWPILPGVPLITANGDGDFKPPVIDPDTIGDVDLVIRAGHLTPGATMPPPALVPPIAAAGGSRFPGGSDIPFTVIASDGDPTVPGGHPLLGSELDGIPVVVAAFADLDRDGVVGPTNADPDGAADNARELQESEFPVGVRVAYFTNGVAQGVIAADVGAPASAGGLPVVLTAAAYVGQFSIDFFLGTVPDGPAIATLMPFFPRLDPDRVLDTDGSAGPGLPDGRIGIELESEFAPPVGDPVLGTPFALPTDGSSITIDRALVAGGSASRARFVQPAAFAGLTGNEPRLPLRPGAGGVLFEPLTDVVSLVIDGPGNGVPVRIVPVDMLGNVTDPATPLTVDLVVSNDVVIASPDTDGDPARESVPLADGTGVVVTLDDTGVVTDHGAFIDVEIDGARADRLVVHFTDGPPNTAPGVFVTLSDGPDPVSLDCPGEPRRIEAQIFDAENDLSGATAILSQNGAELARVELAPSGAPDVWSAPLPLPSGLQVGVLAVTVTARDARGNVSEPAVTGLTFVQSFPPEILDLSVSPTPLPKGKRRRLTIMARFPDACGLKRVTAAIQRGKRRKRIVDLNDRGEDGDIAAADGLFTGMRRLRIPRKPTLTVEITARNARDQSVARAFAIPIGR